MAGGRPTDYTPELLDKARSYLKFYGRGGDVIPTIEGLALMIHISRETIYAWCKDDTKQEFSDIVKEIQQKQAKLLINKGLTGDFQHQIAKLMLSKHGYRESQEVEHSGGLKVNVVNFGDTPASPQVQPTPIPDSASQGT